MSGNETGGVFFRPNPSRHTAASIIRPHPDRRPTDPGQTHWEVQLPDGTAIGTLPEDKFFELCESLSAGRGNDSQGLPDYEDGLVTILPEGVEADGGYSKEDLSAMIERHVGEVNRAIRENRSPTKQEKPMRNWSKVGLISAVATVLMAIFLIPWAQKQFFADEPYTLADSMAVVQEKAMDSDENRTFAEAVTGQNESLYWLPVGDVHVVEKGDALERLAGRNDMLAVAHQSGVENPDKIYVGQILIAPAGVKFHKRTFRIVNCAETAKGYCVYSNPGGDPMCGVRDPLKALTSPGEYGLSAGEAIAVVGGAGELVTLPAGTVLNNLSFGHGHMHGPIVLMKDMSALRLATVGGDTYLRFSACCNLASMKAPEEPVAVETVPEPEVPVVPPEIAPEPLPPAEPAVESPPEETHTAPLPPEEAGVSEGKDEKPCCQQVDAYVGAGKVWHQDSHYGYIGFDWYYHCWVLIDKDGGVHRLGVGADYAWGSGHAGVDAKFKWDMLTLRPVAYKYEGPDGKTLRLRLLFARLKDGVTADMARYENNRRMWFWGPEVIFTDQGRKDEGEKWFSEYRLSASLLFAFDKKGSHSWEGNEITDTSELLKLEGMLRTGARLYIRDLDNGMRTFAQAGFSAQWPNVARNLGLAVGLEGEDELWTVWTGPSFDLIQHSHSWVAEVSLNLGNMYIYRQSLAKKLGIEMAVECVENGGYAYYPEQGLMLEGACPKDAK